MGRTGCFVRQVAALTCVGAVDNFEGLFMFLGLPQITIREGLAQPGEFSGDRAGMTVFACPTTNGEAPSEDYFLSPWMSPAMTPNLSNGEDEYFDDLDDEDFDDEFDDDFEEELDDDLAALNPEVTEEDLVEADDDLGGMFDEEEGGPASPEAEPAAEPEEEE
jgi:hypothetical protein